VGPCEEHPRGGHVFELRGEVGVAREGRVGPGQVHGGFGEVQPVEPAVEALGQSRQQRLEAGAQGRVPLLGGPALGNRLTFARIIVLPGKSALVLRPGQEIARQQSRLGREEAILDLGEKLATQAIRLGEVGLDGGEFVLAFLGLDRPPGVDDLYSLHIRPADQLRMFGHAVAADEDEVTRSRFPRRGRTGGSQTCRCQGGPKEPDRSSGRGAHPRNRPCRSIRDKPD